MSRGEPIGDLVEHPAFEIAASAKQARPIRVREIQRRPRNAIAVSLERQQPHERNMQSVAAEPFEHGRGPEIELGHDGLAVHRVGPNLFDAPNDVAILVPDLLAQESLDVELADRFPHDQGTRSTM